MKGDVITVFDGSVYEGVDGNSCPVGMKLAEPVSNWIG